MKNRICFALLFSGALLLSAGCGDDKEQEINSSDSSSSVSAAEAPSKSAESSGNTGTELENALGLCTSYLQSIDDTRFNIYSSDTGQGVRLNFTDISEKGCTVSWDAYTVREYSSSLNQDCMINGTLYGSKYCTFEPLYKSGSLESLLLDGILMTSTTSSSDGTPVVDVYNYRIIPDLSASTCKLCFTRGTSGFERGDFEYSGNKMQDLYAGGDDQHIIFASAIGNIQNIGAVKYEGHYYKVFDEPMAWTEARDACEAAGGYLACISTSDEQAFIQELIKDSDKGNIWIGGYYSRPDRSWHWVDGSDWGYTNWDKSQPDNYTGDEFYLRMKNRYTQYEYWEALDGKWNDTSDTADGSDPYADAPVSTFGYVCEWEAID